MLRRLFCFALFATCAAAGGCASDEPKKDDTLNDLWKQGYGYNNPNADRLKQGLPPVNFDGSSSEK